MTRASRGVMCGLFWTVSLILAMVAQADEQPSVASEPLVLHARVREAGTGPDNSQPGTSRTSEKVLTVGARRRRPSSSATCGTSTGVRGRPAGSASWPRR